MRPMGGAPCAGGRSKEVRQACGCFPSGNDEGPTPRAGYSDSVVRRDPGWNWIASTRI